MAALPPARLLPLGAGAGAFAGLFGVGGGSIVVPALIAWGTAAHRATAASLVAIAAMAAVGALVHAVAYGALDVGAAVAVGLPAVPGVLAGTALQQRLDERTVATAFAVVVLIVAATLLTGVDVSPAAGEPGPLAYGALAAVGVLGGVMSGLLGVGGGAVFVPGLVACLGMDLVAAEAASLLAIVPVALLGAARHRAYGTLDLRVGGVLALASVPGALVGVVVVHALPVRLVEVLFGLLLVRVAWGLLRGARQPAPRPAP